MKPFWAFVIVLFLVVCCVFIVLLVLWPWLRVFPQGCMGARYDCVVSAYRENLDWLRGNELQGFPNIIVYAKHEDTIKQWPSCIPLPNVGRCDHSYLYHIVHNYNNLAPITLFLTASTYTLGYKMAKLDYIIFPRLKSRFRCLGHSRKPSRAFIKTTWHARGQGNTGTKKGDDTCIPANVRPFGVWWDNQFQGRIPFPKFSVLSGVFATTREAIRGVPLHIWQNLLEQHEVGDNVEVGHYMEQSWYQLLQKGYKE